MLHTIRTALGSFFLAMSNKPARNISDQIQLLKDRGIFAKVIQNGTININDEVKILK